MNSEAQNASTTDGDIDVDIDVDVDVDVVIVGGGPVGVTGALLLAKLGMSVRLFEKTNAVYDLPRAVGMDDEIQRIFQGVGLTDALEDEITPIVGAEFVDVEGTRIVGREIPIGGPYPQAHHPSVMFHQPSLENWLRARALEAGADLQLGVTVDEVTSERDRILVSTSAANGTKTRCSARWVIAADGAASPVRKALGVGLVDHGFDQDWLVFDVELKRPVPGLPAIPQQICNPERPATFVPGHKQRRRWEFQLQPGDDRDEITKPENVWRLISPWLTPEDAVLHRAVVYRFHATVAENLVHDRVLLAGDAAHQMPPFLGQGMCTGIRDVANLAWKLDLINRGVLSEDLLKTYDVERRPHAIDMVAFAVDVGRLIDQLSGKGDSGVGLESGYGGGRPFPYLQAGVLAGGHPRVGKPFPQPMVDGHRFDDLLGQGFSVVATDPATVPVAVSEAMDALGGSVVQLPDSPLVDFVPDGGSVIVRPDRYVAAVASSGEELIQLMGELMSLMGTTGL